ncbi:hypothetical protein I79_017608 [Cricetulus griseus]|uniref:Uncharacterized protein n=1 Tax=Cricetulus griseus TaxID=10029 RepID=G3I2G5_CRIGR|nr:hypothetical protein I79_017608 [Cricetulus griseus]
MNGIPEKLANLNLGAEDTRAHCQPFSDPLSLQVPHPVSVLVPSKDHALREEPVCLRLPGRGEWAGLRVAHVSGRD